MENDLFVQQSVIEKITVKEHPREIHEGVSDSPSTTLKIVVYSVLVACVVAAAVVYSLGGRLIFPLGAFY